MSKKYYLLSEHIKSAESKQYNEKTICYKIASLVFIGKHNEARLLFEKHAHSLNTEDAVFTRFHIGISHTRTSNYRTAKKYFNENLQLYKERKLTSIGSFFTFQGIAFYKYFFSQHRKSLSYAQKAYSFLLNSRNIPAYYQALSLDLQGHNLIQLGSIFLGLNKLSDAYSICEKYKIANLGKEIQISSILYESEFDKDLFNQSKTLEELLNKTNILNDYSKSEIVLQLTKIYILMGKLAFAIRFLLENMATIYKYENRRLLSKLNLLTAQMLLHKGQFVEAFSILKVAEKYLVESTDISLLLPILGLESKILNLLNQDSKHLDNQIKIILKKTDRYLNRRIQNRTSSTHSNFTKSEDQMGDLLDKIHTNPLEALQDVLDNGLLIYIPHIFDIPHGSRTFIYSLEKKLVIFINTEEIEVKKIKLTQHQHQIIQLLTKGSANKEKMIKLIWGYSYDSLRHDSLIYSSLARLRKISPLMNEILLSDGENYFLSPH